jgi:hypothetical protein
VHPLSRLLLLAVAVFGFVEGLRQLGAVFAGSGIVWSFLHLLCALVLIPGAIAFAFRKRWGFLVMSLLVLAAFFYCGFQLILAVDRGGAVTTHAMYLVVDLVAIACISRWGFERHFQNA